MPVIILSIIFNLYVLGNNNIETVINNNEYLSRSNLVQELTQKIDKESIYIYLSDTSKTDTTWKKNNDNFLSDKKIFIKKNQNKFDFALDFIHEITHYVYNEKINPFDPNLKLDDYLMDIIFSEGGELGALLNECLFIKENANYIKKINHWCNDWSLKSSDEIKILIKKELLKVGIKDQTSTFQELSSFFIRNISIESPRFYSGHKKKPYLLSAIEDYYELNKDYCKINSHTQIRSQRCFSY